MALALRSRGQRAVARGWEVLGTLGVRTTRGASASLAVLGVSPSRECTAITRRSPGSPRPPCGLRPWQLGGARTWPDLLLEPRSGGPASRFGPFMWSLCATASRSPVITRQPGFGFLPWR